MNRTHVFGGLLVAIVLAIGVGVAFYTGAGPAPGGAGDGERITDFPTETASEGGSDGSAPSGSGGTTETPPFTFAIDSIEECGQTCRDVTATLHNNQNETARGITVYTRIFAGRDNTAEDDIVWEGTEDVGTLEAGGSYTSTRRVELSLQEGMEIESNDGWITILTTVESNEETVTFQDSRQVA